MSKRPESIFGGRANAGLRARIRAIVADTTSCAGWHADTILGLQNTITLYASGRAKLRQVADEYRRRGPSHRTTCGCASCYHINLHSARPAGR